MAYTADQSIPQPGRFGRALTAISAFVQAMESTSFDYTLDRIEGLEREVRQLREELRQSCDPSAGDAHK